jgi:hypothetical protein
MTARLPQAEACAGGISDPRDSSRALDVKGLVVDRAASLTSLGGHGRSVIDADEHLPASAGDLAVGQPDPGHIVAVEARDEVRTWGTRRSRIVELPAEQGTVEVGGAAQVRRR